MESYLQPLRSAGLPEYYSLSFLPRWREAQDGGKETGTPARRSQDRREAGKGDRRETDIPRHVPSKAWEAAENKALLTHGRAVPARPGTSTCPLREASRSGVDRDCC